MSQPSLISRLLQALRNLAEADDDDHRLAIIDAIDELTSIDEATAPPRLKVEMAPEVPVTSSESDPSKYILRDIAGALVGAFGDYGELSEGKHFARLRVGPREVTAQGDTEMDAAERALSILLGDAHIFMGET